MWEWIVIIILIVIIFYYFTYSSSSRVLVPPSLVDLKVRGSLATLQWSRVNGINEYKVYVLELPNLVPHEYKVKDPPFNFKVDACKTYQVSVASLDGNLESKKSPPVTTNGQSTGPAIDGVVRRNNTLSVSLPTKGGPYRVTAGSSPDNLNLTGKITSPGRPSDFTVDVSSIPPKDPIYIEAVEIVSNSCTTSPTKYTYQP